MNRILLSPPAAALLRALLDRCGDLAGRIVLSELHSADWQSLTFTGERHTLRFRMFGDEAEAAAERLIGGLAEAEFAIPGQIVADIALAGPIARDADGAMTVAIEALTIAD